MSNSINIPNEARPFMLWDMCGQMTCRQVAIYLTIKMNPGISVGPLAKALNSPKPSITRAVDKLESMGLILRVVDTYDRRKVNLTARASSRRSKLT